MDEDIFDEMNHWLRFIERWQQESDEPVPEQAINALEYAIEKAIKQYRHNKDFFSSQSDAKDTLH